MMKTPNHTPSFTHRAKQWRMPALTVGVLAALGVNIALAAITPIPSQTGHKAVQLNPGPLNNVSNASNVALALSVEFPTIGAAYRANPDDNRFVPYDRSTTYIGYWDSNACYKYGDTSSGAPLGGEYFYRSGTATKDSNGYRNCSNTYSGNLLNFAATSAIDVLRIALTGGHREVDTEDHTILARAYLSYKGMRNVQWGGAVWDIHSMHFPSRKIPSNVWGKEIPLPRGISGDYIYASSCQNKIWFGESAGSFVPCETNQPQIANYARTSTSPYEKRYSGYHKPNANRRPQYNFYNTETKQWSRWQWKRNATSPFACNGFTPFKTNINATNPNKYDYYTACYVIRTSDGALVGASEGAPSYESDKNRNLSRQQGGQYVPFIARVKACDATDAAARKAGGVEGIDICQQYPNGNYKPVGELQKNANNVRVATFSYLNEPDTRYGGVLRAPMSYIGPKYLNQHGTSVTNPQAEWNAGTGIFTKNPRGSNFTYSGSINYLNRFGTLVAGQQGRYKGNDPLGQMYYEALRYFMGKQPDPRSISGVSSSPSDDKADGYPFAKSWTDPIQNSCSKDNFILTIGDVNTWEVRSTRPEPRRGLDTETLLGGGTFNPMEKRDEILTREGFTHFRGREKTAIAFAGAAWLANTQSIRNDTDSEGKSLKDLRVRTFGIDVDENGNGSMDNSTRDEQRKPRQGSIYLAGKYGWFEDKNGDGKPDSGEWDQQETGTPDGFVLASHADKLLAGIKQFFNAAQPEQSYIGAATISSTRFSSVSPSRELYSKVNSHQNWTGDVKKEVITMDVPNSTTPTYTYAWSAADILTNHTNWEDRKIFTYTEDDGGQAFTFANKSNLEEDVVEALEKDANSPTNAADAANLENRINFIRGDRSNEIATDGSGMFRRRTSLFGDVGESEPQYKKYFDALYGEGYSDFARDNKNRKAAVYIGANDGMLHAFDADNGKELFAYIPLAASKKLNNLTKVAYEHTQFVDAVPAINEAALYSTATGGTPTWKTILASGMGGGAQGVFVLDVTKPESFGASNVLFEFTDDDDDDMGNVTAAPRIVKMKMAGTNDSRWFVAVSSGYNNYADDDNESDDAAQALFLLSLDKKASDDWEEGTNYFKIKVQAPAVAASNNNPVGLANPAVATDSAGNTIALYAGDLHGQLWKFDFRNGISATEAASAVKKSGGNLIPLATLADSTLPDAKRQSITTTPTVTKGSRKGYMVLVGTGKYMESSDTTAAVGKQAVYGVWDDLSTYGITRDQFYVRKFVPDASGVITTLNGGSTFAFGTGTGKYMGWAAELPRSSERVVRPGTVASSDKTTFNSIVPAGACQTAASSGSLCFNNVYGTSCANYIKSTGLLGRMMMLQLDESPVNSVTYGKRSATGRRSFTQKPVGIIRGADGTKTMELNTITGFVGRMGWREISNFLN